MKEGTVVQCIGAVIDVEFSREHLPKIYDALTLEEAGLTLEVQQQLGDGVVRTICLGSSDGLRRGMKVQNSGAPIMVPVGPKTLGRIMDVLGRPIDEAGPVGAEKTMSIHRVAPAFEELSPSTELLETGVKVITLPDIRWKRRDIKSTALLAQTMGKQEAKRRGAYEAWMVEDGFVTEGTSSTAFILDVNGYFR